VKATGPVADPSTVIGADALRRISKVGHVCWWLLITWPSTPIGVWGLICVSIVLRENGGPERRQHIASLLGLQRGSGEADTGQERHGRSGQS